MSNPIKVYDAFFENDNADNIFYYTGKSNIIGLQAPDHVLHNEKDLRYIRILNISLPDNDDIELRTSFHEMFKIVLTPDVYGTGIVRTNPETIYCTLNGLFMYNDSGKLIINTELIYETTDTPIYDSTNSPVMLCTTDLSVIDGVEKKSLSVWLDTDYFSDYEYINIFITQSLSASLAPINGESFYPGSYLIDYINDSNVVVDTNITNTEPKSDTGNGDIFYVFNKTLFDRTRVNEIEKTISNNETFDRQTAVIYDVEFVPTATETTMNPSVLRRISLDSDSHLDVSTDNVGRTIILGRQGLYEFQLKNGFYLIQGETRLDINVYINNWFQQELSMSMYLTSNGEEDARKAIKNTITSPVVKLRCDKGSNIRIAVSCTNPENIVCENETELLITYVRYTEYVDSKVLEQE